MNWLTNILAGLKSLFARERSEQELDEELDSYLEASAAHKQNIGMSPEAANRAALVELGSRYSVKDKSGRHDGNPSWTISFRISASLFLSS